MIAVGFSISVKQRSSTICPHCHLAIHGDYDEELYYAQKNFFDDYWNEKPFCTPRNHILEMQKALGIVENNNDWWSQFGGEGNVALEIIDKIKHLIDENEYNKIVKVLQLPNTVMQASW